MLRRRRFAREIDPAPVQIKARKVHFDLSGIPLEWIRGHPVASTMINPVPPAAEHWFVPTYNDALRLVRSQARRRHPRLHRPGGDARPAHDEVIRELLVGNGVDPPPVLALVESMLRKGFGINIIR